MSTPPPPRSPSPRRVFVVGATGYVGRHVVRALVDRGHDVVALARPRSGVGGRDTEADTRAALEGAEVRFGEAADPTSVTRDGTRGEPFDAVVSCLATRTGATEDAWRVEHRAQLGVLAAARRAGAEHFVLLSAICVQKPRLPFQHAKLAFERALVESGLGWSIVRPTAFFKSLSGQVEAVRRGKPYLLLGDGRLTATKPISERDLAGYVADCLDDPGKRDRVLPVGGPGAPITPLEQGELLFRLTGRPPRYRRLPLRAFDAIVGTLGALGRLAPPLAAKADLARIGRYYATESMLVWDAARGVYDADATPSHGSDTLEAHYARVLREGIAGHELGDHALFSRDGGGQRRDTTKA